MKTKEELNNDIRKITLKIQEEFPELSKYLNERPIDHSVSPDNGVSRKNLEAYYNSLKEMLKGYSEVKMKTETQK